MAPNIKQKQPIKTALNIKQKEPIKTAPNIKQKALIKTALNIKQKELIKTAPKIYIVDTNKSNNFEHIIKLVLHKLFLFFSYFYKT